MALLSTADIIDRSWELYRRHLRTMLLFVVLLFIPDVVVALLADLALPALASRGIDRNILLGLSLAVYLPLSCISLWVSIGLLRAIAALIRGETVAWRPILKNAISVILPTAAAAIALLIFFVAGTVALVVPAVIFSIWFAFVLPYIVLDHIPWTKAFARSKELVRGRFWPILWRTMAPHLFWFLLATVFSASLIFLMNGLTGTWSVQLAVGAPDWLVLSANIVDGAVRALTTPLILSSMTLLFLSLKESPPPPTA